MLWKTWVSSCPPWQQWECIVIHLTQKIEYRVPDPSAEIYQVPHAEVLSHTYHLALSAAETPSHY